jgi:hypothetical protein
MQKKFGEFAEKRRQNVKDKRAGKEYSSLII